MTPDEEGAMKRPIQLLIVGLVVALGAVPVFAQFGDHLGAPAGRREAGILFMLLRGANLDAEQQTRLREIVVAHRGKSEQLIKQLRAAQDELLDRLLAPGPVQSDDLRPVRQRIAQLWEQDKLRPDDRVAKYIPEFAAGGKDAITIRHVLTHTGGFRSVGANW